MAADSNRYGINSGVMSVGDMGSRFRRAYTVLGMPIQSRLEGADKPRVIHWGRHTRRHQRLRFREL